MFKPLVLITTLLMISACDNKNVSQKSSAINSQPRSISEQYRHQAMVLLTGIRAKQTPTNIAHEAAKLVTISQILLAQFSEQFPLCKEYLDTLTIAAPKIAMLELERIESDYFKGGKLPEFSLPICYHAKELLVHGAAVQAIAQNKVLDDSFYNQADINVVEAIAHLDEVQKVMAN